MAISVSSDFQLDQISGLTFIKNIKTISLETHSKKSGHDKFQMETESYRADYGDAWAQVGMLSVDELHRAGYTGKGVLIAIIDAGFRHVDTLKLFQKLWTNGQIIGQWDFVENDGNALHGSNHGMQVLSTMACEASGKLVGTSPHASYVLYRTEDISSEKRIEEYNWAAAAEYADSVGADIINSSLGYTVFDDARDNYTYAQMDGKTAVCTQAAEKAASKGIVVVNSAGNSGSGSWYHIGAPADGPNVFSIGAVTSDQMIAAFSSRGPNSAGVLKPNVCGQGQLATIASTVDSIEIQKSNGTSFSAPIIAGACASLIQANPNSNAVSIKLAIEQSAHLHSTPDNNFGHGIPDFSKADEILKNNRFDFKSPDYWNAAVLSPNPALNFFNLELVCQVDESISIEIHDSKGSHIRSFNLRGAQGYNKFRINVEELNTGVYMVFVKRASYEFTKKLIIGRL